MVSERVTSLISVRQPANPWQWDEGRQHWGPTPDTNGRRETYPGQFGSDLVQRYALDFIDRNATRPFFLFCTMILPHNPWVATPARKDASDRQEKFSAMMEYLDAQVGEVLDRLDALDIVNRPGFSGDFLLRIMRPEPLTLVADSTPSQTLLVEHPRWARAGGGC